MSALAGAKGKRLTDFMAGGLVAGVEALEAEAAEPKAATADVDRQNAVRLKAYVAQMKAAKSQRKGG